MFPHSSYNNIYDDTIINISDEVIVLDSSSSDTNGSGNVININDTDYYSITRNSESVISISDSSDADCGSTIVISDDSKNSSYPSFDFVSSTKMLLLQPRTSTPSLRIAADAVVAADTENDRECYLMNFCLACFYIHKKKKKKNQTCMFLVRFSFIFFE